MADIGATLREARMRARIDIGEVESKTKIRAKYLRAIENEEWDLLPGPVYAKSFLRTYGDYLGLDSRMLVDEFRRQYERPSDHELKPIASISRERERAARGPRIPPWLVIGLVLVGVVAALYVLGNNSNKEKQQPVTGAGTHHKKSVKHHHKAAPPKPKTVRVQLVPTGPLYVCAVNGAGKKLVNEQTFQPGQTVPTLVGQKILVTLGNNAVQMKVNGKTVPVTASSNAIRLLIDPTGEHPTSSTTPPTCP
jgi:cytoskeletal protein RodZ